MVQISLNLKESFFSSFNTNIGCLKFFKPEEGECPSCGIIKVGECRRAVGASANAESAMLRYWGLGACPPRNFLKFRRSVTPFGA